MRCCSNAMRSGSVCASKIIVFKLCGDSLLHSDELVHKYCMLR